MSEKVAGDGGNVHLQSGLLLRVKNDASCRLVQRDGSLDSIQRVLHLFLGVIERKIDRHRDAHPPDDLKKLVLEVRPKAQRAFLNLTGIEEANRHVTHAVRGIRLG